MDATAVIEWHAARARGYYVMTRTRRMLTRRAIRQARK